MIICKLYDHNGIKLNDKKKVQLILGVIGRRDTFQDSSVSYRINSRMHRFRFMHVINQDMMITKQQNYNPENIQGMTIISYT